MKSAAALALLLVIGAGLLRSSSGQGLSFDHEHSGLDVSEAKEFTEFPLYNVGESFEGIPLLHITRRLDTPQAPDYYRTNFVNFIYGDCEVFADTGCLPPFQIQVWPACIRNLSSYALTPAGDPLPHKPVTVRGVPAAVFEDPRVEIYTGRETVVIFAANEEFSLRIAEEIESVDAAEPILSDERLPAPASGALEGELICTSEEYGSNTPPQDER